METDGMALISKSSGTVKTILQGTVKGARRRQKKGWEDNIKEWNGVWRFPEGSGRHRKVLLHLCAPRTIKVKELWWEMRWVWAPVFCVENLSNLHCGTPVFFFFFFFFFWNRHLRFLFWNSQWEPCRWWRGTFCDPLGQNEIHIWFLFHAKKI